VSVVVGLVQVRVVLLVTGRVEAERHEPHLDPVAPDAPVPQPRVELRDVEDQPHAAVVVAVGVRRQLDSCRP
jgi:hypothetical protein